jgi:hypothetical protein
MKARTSYRKGIEFERQVRRALAAIFGDPQVQRGHPTPGTTAVPDVIAPGLLVECKTGKRVLTLAALRQAVRQTSGRRGFPVAVCKQDRRTAVVTMRFEDFIVLLREWHEARLHAR